MLAQPPRFSGNTAEMGQQVYAYLFAQMEEIEQRLTDLDSNRRVAEDGSGISTVAGSLSRTAAQVEDIQRELRNVNTAIAEMAAGLEALEERVEAMEERTPAGGE